MIHSHVNYLAVIAAAVGAMIVGFVWYSQPLFGGLWTKIIGKENLSAAEQEQMKKEVGPYFGMMFAGTLVGAFVFSLFIRWLNARRRSRGCRSASGRGLVSSFPLAEGRPCSAERRRA